MHQMGVNWKRCCALAPSARTAGWRREQIHAWTGQLRRPFEIINQMLCFLILLLQSRPCRQLLIDKDARRQQHALLKLEELLVMVFVGHLMPEVAHLARQQLLV